jgi:hypothetical protein
MSSWKISGFVGRRGAELSSRGIRASSNAADRREDMGVSLFLKRSV